MENTKFVSSGYKSYWLESPNTNDRCCGIDTWKRTFDCGLVCSYDGSNGARPVIEVRKSDIQM